MEKAIVIGLAIIIAVGIGMKIYLSTYDTNDEMILKTRKKLEKVVPEASNIYIRDGNSSYNVNRKYITLCVRDPVTQEYYNEHIVMYVALHEIVHTLVDSDFDIPSEDDPMEYDKDHGPLFVSTFKRLLNKAISMGLYDPRYKVPDDYCGGKYI